MTPVLRKLAPPPTMEDREEFAEKAKDAALVLIGAVRDDAPPRVWAHLQDLHPTQLLGMCIVLAAMVPDHLTLAELLDWTEGLTL